MTPLADIVDWIARAGTVLGLGSWLIYFIRRRIIHRQVTAFFGGRSVDVFLPRRTLNGREVIAEPDFVAGLELYSFMSRHGVTVHFRFLSHYDQLHMTTPGAVVICGPKSSSTVARLLHRDPVLDFRENDGEWALIDSATHRAFRPKRNADGQDSDIGYLSRTSEDDGASRHTVVWVAGIHAPGSAVVASWLSRPASLRKLHKRTKYGPFSAIVSGDFTTAPMTVINTHLTFLERHKKVVE